MKLLTIAMRVPGHAPFYIGGTDNKLTVFILSIFVISI
jgi:hypothetical protein